MSFLSIQLGILFLYINSKNLLDASGLLPISIFLIIIPAMINYLNIGNFKLSPFKSLSLLILPLIFMNYIYYIKAGAPVGFSDPHYHIFTYTYLLDEYYKIDFTSIMNISFNFVGLYILFKFIEVLSGLDIIQLACFLPPILNMIIVLLCYVIVNRLLSQDEALFATMLYGWQYYVILFGQEMRTQTMGVILIFSFVGVILISQDLQIIENDYPANIKIVSLLLLFGIVTASFVTIFYTSIMILTMLLCSVLSLHIAALKFKNPCITVQIFIIFVAFFISYLLYIGSSFLDVFSTILLLVKRTILSTDDLIVPSILSSAGGDVASPVAGIFAYYVNHLLLLLFIIFSIVYVMYFFNRKSTMHLIFFISFGALVSLWFYSIIFQLYFSPGRLYAIAFLLIATVISFGFKRVQILLEKNHEKYPIMFYKICLILVMVMLVSASIIQNTNYVIGETAPFRSIEYIDGTYYWDKNEPLYSLTSFLFSCAYNQTIYLNILLVNYYFLDVCKLKYLSISKYAFEKNKAKYNNLIILHDKFKAQYYSYRYILPSPTYYISLNKIYSNDDYLLFAV